MSLKTYFLHPEEFELYYNCNTYKVEQIPLENRTYPYRGASFIVVAIILELCYLPCIYAMLQKRLRQQFVYKQMLLMSFGEMVDIVMHGIVVGIESISGDVYCVAPQRFYWFGVIELGFAYAQSAQLLILALNRCLILVKPRLAQVLFGRTGGWAHAIAWSIPPFAISAFLSWIGPPVIFNPIKGSQFQNPHLGYLPDNEYYHTPQAFPIYTIGFIIAVPIMYGIFGIFLWRLLKQNSISMNNKKVRRETGTFVQVLISCVLCFIACLAYIIQQHYSEIDWLALTATFGYLMFQGSSAIIYLTMNRSIRLEIAMLADSFSSRIVPKHHPELSVATCA
ncbi:serpentine type 7TM GPCR chemoreceptor srt domain-containing protein [Ditylenchus destructor]|uniref:Serpentine type 7TM GPCR chemoreceptor srt domain-containing protein n=1 Tax=Ditylenchus destructor TaxID=166010 RepID=A0AAD4QYH0_9BILA|nr:serpentine type 7TM GPCR chemoreceptor srt domain-containing protein [Ditylenchus destructor]